MLFLTSENRVCGCLNIETSLMIYATAWLLVSVPALVYTFYIMYTKYIIISFIFVLVYGLLLKGAWTRNPDDLSEWLLVGGIKLLGLFVFSALWFYFAVTLLFLDTVPYVEGGLALGSIAFSSEYKMVNFNIDIVLYFICKNYNFSVWIE